MARVSGNQILTFVAPRDIDARAVRIGTGIRKRVAVDGVLSAVSDVNSVKAPLTFVAANKFVGVYEMAVGHVPPAVRSNHVNVMLPVVSELVSDIHLPVGLQAGRRRAVAADSIAQIAADIAVFNPRGRRVVQLNTKSPVV